MLWFFLPCGSYFYALIHHRPTSFPDHQRSANLMIFRSLPKRSVGLCWQIIISWFFLDVSILNLFALIAAVTRILPCFWFQSRDHHKVFHHQGSIHFETGTMITTLIYGVWSYEVLESRFPPPYRRPLPKGTQNKTLQTDSYHPQHGYFSCIYFTLLCFTPNTPEYISSLDVLWENHHYGRFSCLFPNTPENTANQKYRKNPIDSSFLFFLFFPSPPLGERGAVFTDLVCHSHLEAPLDRWRAKAVRHTVSAHAQAVGTEVLVRKMHACCPK